MIPQRVELVTQAEQLDVWLMDTIEATVQLLELLSNETDDDCLIDPGSEVMNKREVCSYFWFKRMPERYMVLRVCVLWRRSLTMR